MLCVFFSSYVWDVQPSANKSEINPMLIPYKRTKYNCLSLSMFWVFQFNELSKSYVLASWKPQGSTQMSLDKKDHSSYTVPIPDNADCDLQG